MNKVSFLKVWVIVIAMAIGIVLISGPMVQAQFPVSYYYTNPLFYNDYGYFNTIDGYLLGYLPFSPYLGPSTYAIYNLAGIPTYPYITSPYQTTFPYTTLPGTVIPYERFDYPTYTYGSPDFYLSWTLLQ